MAISGHSMRSLMSRAVYRYRNSGWWLPGTIIKLKSSAVVNFQTEDSDPTDDVKPNPPDHTTGDQAKTMESSSEDDSTNHVEDHAVHGSSEQSSPPTSDLSIVPTNVAANVEDSAPGDAPIAESEKLPEEIPSSTLSDVLLNPPPAAPSVDNLISESLGNIFQKKTVKNPELGALLALHGDSDIRESAKELKEFAAEIGAGKNTN